MCIDKFGKCKLNTKIYRQTDNRQTDRQVEVDSDNVSKSICITKDGSILNPCGRYMHPHKPNAYGAISDEGYK